MRAIWAGLINLAIYIGNVVHKNRRKRDEKKHPAGLPRDVQYYWRFERDSNAGKCWAQARCFRFYDNHCHFIFGPTKARFAPVLGLYFMQKIKIKTRCFHNEYLLKF